MACACSSATATATLAPTMGLLPMPRKPIISTCAGTDERARELGVAVHAAHGVGHAVAGGTGGHVVGVQGAAGAAAADATEKYFLPCSRHSFL